MLQENILIILKRKGQTDRIITTHLIHALAKAENGRKKYIELSFVEYKKYNKLWIYSMSSHELWNTTIVRTV